MRNAADMIVIATLLHEHGPTGVQAHIGAFRRYAESKGLRVVVVTPFSAPRWMVYPIFAVRRILTPLSGTASVIWYRYWHRVFLETALRRVLRENSSAIVYAQCPLAARAGLDARRDRSQRVGLVVHFNRSQADEWIEQGYLTPNAPFAEKIRALEARTLPELDMIVFVSKFMQSIVTERIPAAAGVRHDVIPNFCGPESTSTEPLPLVDLISIGTLEPRKNQEFLLRVLAAANRLGRKYSLALIGDGPDRSRLERLATELGLIEQVRFLGLQPNASRFLRSAKAYVHGATMENLPLALIEALRSARPILAPAIGGIPDIFTHGEEGFFWPLSDAEKSAELLIELMEGESLRTRMGLKASARFDKDFSAERVGLKLLSFLSERPKSHSVNARAA